MKKTAKNFTLMTSKSFHLVVYGINIEMNCKNINNAIFSSYHMLGIVINIWLKRQEKWSRF